MNVIMQFATTHPWALALLVSASSHLVVYFPSIALRAMHLVVSIPWVQAEIRKNPVLAQKIVDIVAAAAKQAIADAIAAPVPPSTPAAPPAA